MSPEETTNYAVQMTFEDGTKFPENDELDWFSYEGALRIAGISWGARQRMTGSKVKTISVIDAGYNTVQSHTFED